jgi:hypothetical protein
MLMLALLVALAVVAVAFTVAWDADTDARRAAGTMEQDWLPPELHGAKLAYSEPRPMRILRPVPVVAKVDRAYRHPEGDLSVVEFKTRPRHVVYPSDVLELSQQRLVLERSGRGKVRPVGFVVTELRGSGDRRTHRVRLLEQDDAVKAARRYKGIIEGTVMPRKTDNVRFCAKCAFVQECRPELLERTSNPREHANA